MITSGKNDFKRYRSNRQKKKKKHINIIFRGKTGTDVMLTNSIKKVMINKTLKVKLLKSK